MFQFLVGNLFGAKKAIDDIIALDGTQHFYEVFQKSLLFPFHYKSGLFLSDYSFDFCKNIFHLL